MSILTENTQTIQHNYQTKTMFSPQGPYWSRHSIARVQRHDDNYIDINT
jgi:hypothetical protein